jgi:hypothetical protein
LSAAERLAAPAACGVAPSPGWLIGFRAAQAFGVLQALREFRLRAPDISLSVRTYGANQDS